MKTKLLGERGEVLPSVITAVLYHVFKYITFIALYVIATFIVLPSLSLYSRELGDIIYSGYETLVPEAWGAAMGITFILASFVCAGYNYRFHKKMRKHFFSETFGMINYKDGLKWFNSNYGVLDRVLTCALSLVVNGYLAAKMPVLAPVILLGVPADCFGAYVSLRRGLTLWRIHSITCD